MTASTTDIRWPRTAWLEAVYVSDLRPLERLTAAIYADHARDSDRAWVTLDRLVERSGMARTTAMRARDGLVDAGWLVAVSAPNRRKATVYALAVPHASSSAPRPLSSSGATPLSSSAPHASSSAPITEQSRSDTQRQSLPENKPHPGDGMTDTDDALAAFSTSHPGREREALRAALAWFERTKGDTCRNPAAYFGRWEVDQLQRTFKLPKLPKPTRNPDCPDCDGMGIVLTGPDRQPTGRRCECAAVA
jgi:hypothetical protein